MSWSLEVAMEVPLFGDHQVQGFHHESDRY